MLQWRQCGREAVSGRTEWTADKGSQSVEASWNALWSWVSASLLITLSPCSADFQQHAGLCWPSLNYLCIDCWFSILNHALVLHVCDLMHSACIYSVTNGVGIFYVQPKNYIVGSKPKALVQELLKHWCCTRGVPLNKVHSCWPCGLMFHCNFPTHCTKIVGMLFSFGGGLKFIGYSTQKIPNI